MIGWYDINYLLLLRLLLLIYSSRSRSHFPPATSAHSLKLLIATAVIIELLVIGCGSVVSYIQLFGVRRIFSFRGRVGWLMMRGAESAQWGRSCRKPGSIKEILMGIWVISPILLLDFCCMVLTEVLLLQVAKVDDLLGHVFIVLHGKETVLGEFLTQVGLNLFLWALMLCACRSSVQEWFIDDLVSRSRSRRCSWSLTLDSCSWLLGIEVVVFVAWGAEFCRDCRILETTCNTLVTVPLVNQSCKRLLWACVKRWLSLLLTQYNFLSLVSGRVNLLLTESVTACWSNCNILQVVELLVKRHHLIVCGRIWGGISLPLLRVLLTSSTLAYLVVGLGRLWSCQALMLTSAATWRHLNYLVLE